MLQTCLSKLRAVPWLGGQPPTSAENWDRSQSSQSEICGGRNSNNGTGFSHCTLFSGQYYPTQARYSLIHSDVIVVGQTRFRVEHICLQHWCQYCAPELQLVMVGRLQTNLVLILCLLCPSLWIPS